MEGCDCMDATLTKNWESDVEAMVKRDRNRACILIWGVGNEVENQGQILCLRF